MEFYENLKKLRKDLGLSQAELAQKLGVSTGLIGMYETNARKPSYEMIELIADYFNVDVDYLLGRTDKTTTIQDEQARIQELQEQLRDNPAIGMLLSAAKDLSEDDIQTLADIAKRFRSSYKD
jgi:transcriptional regulator with XRE-family HTH domain